MNSGFGARLRLQRERQQITLADIADQTKIKASLLERLEHDDVSQWPKGIFRRAYIRAYAQAIGLEPDAVAREFLELYPDPAEEVTPAALVAARNGTHAWPPTRLHLLIGSAIDALPSRRAQSGRQGGGGNPHPAVAAESPSAESQAAPVAPSPPSTAAPDMPANSEPIPDPARNLDLPAIAGICTQLACTADQDQLGNVFADAARALNAVGLIAWVWNPQADALVPGLSHGYPDEVLAHLCRVDLDADNAIAAAFRAGDTRVVDSSDQATGAVVVPLLTPCGCAGVLAVELARGDEQCTSLLAVATIIAAQLSTLIGPASAFHAATA